MKNQFQTPPMRSQSNKPTDKNAYCCSDCSSFDEHLRDPPSSGPRCCMGCQKVNHCEFYVFFNENELTPQCCSNCNLFKYCYAVSWFADPGDVVQFLNRHLKIKPEQTVIVKYTQHDIDEALEAAHQEIILWMPETLKAEIDFHTRSQSIPEYDMDDNTPNPDDITFDPGYDIDKLPPQFIQAEVLLAAYYVVLGSPEPLPEFEQYRRKAHQLLDSVLPASNINAQTIKYTRNDPD